MIPLLCLVIAVHDGDGPLHCANGVSIRVAGIQAPDFPEAPPCRQHRAFYTCDRALAERSKRIVTRLTFRQTLTCEPLGRSYTRVVARCSFADGRDLRCAVERAGAAVEWPVYVVRYRLGKCDG